jgi:hypothetical protein
LGGFYDRNQRDRAFKLCLWPAKFRKTPKYSSHCLWEIKAFRKVKRKVKREVKREVKNQSQALVNLTAKCFYLLESTSPNQ